MSFNDGTADRQSHSHSVRFSRIKRFEEAVSFLRFKPNAGILHTEQDPKVSITCFAAPANSEDTPRLLDCIHGIHSVPHEVEQNLLELTTISQDRRQVLGQVGADRDATVKG